MRGMFVPNEAIQGAGPSGACGQREGYKGEVLSGLAPLRNTKDHEEWRRAGCLSPQDEYSCICEGTIAFPRRSSFEEPSPDMKPAVGPTIAQRKRFGWVASQLVSNA